MKAIIRKEQPSDYKEIEHVIKSAFANVEISDKTEHELVARLRQSAEYISDLALPIDEESSKIVGHILYSKVKIKNGEKEIDSIALAPVSVLPTYQNIGIGKRLIEESLSIANDLQFPSVIVLGHPDYYPKFGFEKASKWGIKPPFEVPDEVFMALELQEGALQNVSGVVHYSSAF